MDIVHIVHLSTSFQILFASNSSQVPENVPKICIPFSTPRSHTFQTPLGFIPFSSSLLIVCWTHFRLAFCSKTVKIWVITNNFAEYFEKCPCLFPSDKLTLTLTNLSLSHEQGEKYHLCHIAKNKEKENQPTHNTEKRYFSKNYAL